MVGNADSVAYTDYTYCPDYDLRARVYDPQSEGPHPIVVDVPGGGWAIGDRKSNKALDRALVQLGIRVVSIDVRTSAVAPFPSAVHDVARAIDWVRANVSRGEPISLLGTSSGGMLAMLNALRPVDQRIKGRRDEDAVKVDRVVGCYPVFDPVARYEYALQNGIKPLIDAHEAFFRGGVADMAAGNPLRIISSGRVSHLPSVLIVQGTRDHNVPTELTVEFAAAYRKAGGVIDLEWCEGLPHGFFLNAIEDDVASLALQRIYNFLNKSPDLPG